MITVKDANAVDRNLKTTEAAGEHTPHQIIDNPDLAKEAKQDTIIAALTTLLSYTDSLESLLTAIQNKIISAPATEAKQDSAITRLTEIRDKIIAAPATEATLAQVLAKIIGAPATEANQEEVITALGILLSQTDGIETILTAIQNKIIASPATEALQIALNNLMSSVIKDEDAAHSTGDKGIMVLAVREDGEGPLSTPSGDFTPLQVNEIGRLKVSAQPGIYNDTVGDITAVQPTIGTPVAGGTVTADVQRASNVMMFCTGTFAGVNCTFEGSLEETGENWFGLQAVRSNANTIETTTGVLAAAPAYAWELSVNGLKRVRVRCTARTSGTQSWRIVLAPYATEPIPAAQISGTQPVSGTVTVTSTRITPNAADGHSTTHHLISAAGTNATLVRGSGGPFGIIVVSNASATARFFKLYNLATAPVVGTSVPVLTVIIPPGQAVVIGGNSPVRLSTGIGYAITGGMPVADTTGIGANEVAVSIFYT